MFLTHLAASLLCVATFACTPVVPVPDEPDEPEVPEEPEPLPTYYEKEKGTFRIVSYNVGAFWKYIPDMNENIGLVASILKEVQADFVGLNELDSMNTRHHANQVARLSAAMGDWKWFFGRGIPYKGGAYGNGIIVPRKQYVVEVYNMALPAPPEGTEARAVSVMETDQAVFAVTHLGSYPAEFHLSQVAALREYVGLRYGGGTKPVFLMGDMNARLTSAAYAKLSEDWDTISCTTENTIGGTSPRVIDYIFHWKNSPAVEVVSAHTISQCYCGDVSTASDHFPIFVDVKFALPPKEE